MANPEQVQPKVTEEEVMDTSDDSEEVLRQALLDSMGGPAALLALAQGGPSFSGAPTAPAAPAGSTAPVGSTAPTGSTAPGVSSAPGVSLSAPGVSLSVATVTSGVTAPTMSTAPSQPGGLQAQMIKCIVDQARKLKQVGVRTPAQPDPGYQVFVPQVPLVAGHQHATSSSIRLGAQLAQLEISQGQSELQVIRANQRAMRATLLENNRQQQKAAAEKRVRNLLSGLSLSFLSFLSVIHTESVTSLEHPTFCCVVSICEML